MGGEGLLCPTNMVKKQNNPVPSTKMTRGTKNLIKEAIQETKSCNRYDILFYMTEKLEERFPGGTLDYQLKRMNLQTTSQILDAIDTYAYRVSKRGDEEDIGLTD